MTKSQKEKLTGEQLIAELSNLISQGLSVNKAARALGYKRNSIYQKLYRMGYKIETEVHIVPIHAAPINSTQTNAA